MKNLHKVTAIICFIIISISTAHAQFGVKAGLNYSNLRNIEGTSDLFDSEFIIGYQFGAVYNLGIGDKFALQPEVSLFQSGSKETFPGPNATAGEIINKYNYLNLTALLQYNLIGNNDGFRLQILGGGFTEYLVSGKNISDINNVVDEVEMDLSSEFAPNRANSGFVYGLGIGFNSFFLHLRGSVGLVDVDEINFTDQNGNLVGNGRLRTRDYSIVAGYIF